MKIKEPIYGSSHPPQVQLSAMQFAEIVASAQSGDQEAFAFLIHQFEGAICGYLRSILRDGELTADFWQEAMIRAWRSLSGTDGGLRSQQAIKQWLFKITTNLTNDYFRTMNRLRTISLEQIEEEANNGNHSALRAWEQLWVEGTEEIVCNKETIKEEHEDVISALYQVSKQNRRCFLLKHVEGLSHSEIAQMLGIEESCSRSYASSGRRQFLVALAQIRANKN